MELSRWNQMLNRDIEVLKGNANISKMRSVSISAKTLNPLLIFNYVWIIC
jgi:hypothetical protein